MAGNTVQINVTAQDNTAQGLGSAQSSLSDFGTKAGGILAAAGAAAGALLISGITTALEQGKITAKLGAQLGATPAEAKKYGDLAGELYADAITEDFQGAADAIKATMQSGLLPADATNAQIKAISTKVSDLANTFDEDLGGVTNAVSQLMRTGLAKNADEAFDIITRGMQSGANKADDLLDTFNEYSTQFRRLGVDGQTATGLISQGLKAGARDADQVADALGQFGERALAGGTAVEEAYASIGLSADEMAAKLGAGGKSAEEALSLTLGALRGTKDEQVKLNAAVALFGDPANVMGDSLYALDPATAAASAGMDKAKGATDELGNALRDSAGAKLEQFRRGLEQNLVEFLGGTVIPAVLGFKETFLGSFLDIWNEAGEGSTGLGDQIVTAFEDLGERIKEKFEELAPKVFEAVTGLGQAIADYITENPVEALKIGLIAAAILLALALLPALIAAGIGAIVMMIVGGFVSRLITILNEKLPEWWEAFTDWVSEKADEAGDVLESWGRAISSFFSGLWDNYIAGPISRQWDRLTDNIRSLPGKITSALSSISRVTSSIGRQIIDGMISGVKSAANGLVSAARDVVGSAIDAAKSVLGISSPSKVFKKIGEQTGEGMAIGLNSMQGRVADEATELSQSAAKAASKGGKTSLDLAVSEMASFVSKGGALGDDIMRSMQGGRDGWDAGFLNRVVGDEAARRVMSGAAVSAPPAPTRAGAGTASTVMQITLKIGEKTLGDLIVDPIRKAVRTRGGNVQAVLGS